MSRLANHFQSEIYALLGLTVQFLIFFQTPTHSSTAKWATASEKLVTAKSFSIIQYPRSLVAEVCVRTVNSTKEFRADQLILNDAYLSILKIRGCCVGHYTNLLCIKSAKPIWSRACKMQMSYFYELVVLQLKLDLLSSRAPIWWCQLIFIFFVKATYSKNWKMYLYKTILQNYWLTDNIFWILSSI